MLIVGGLLALASTVYVGTRLWAQGTTTTPVVAPAQTRVAFVNVGLVFQKYEKYVLYKKEMEKTIEPFRAEAETYKKEILQWQRDLENTDPSRTPKGFNKEQWLEGVKDRKRKLEDLNSRVGKLISQKSEQQLVQLYNEINEAIKAHALDRGFQVVLSYSDPSNLPANTFPAISRKLQSMEGTGALNFMYIAPGLDISQAVIDTLNRRYTTPTANGGTSTGLQPTGGTK
jgi:Skp family chaperone for outer membrane proteins